MMALFVGPTAARAGWTVGCLRSPGRFTRAPTKFNAISLPSACSVCRANKETGMDFTFSEDQLLFQESVRSFLVNENTPEAIRHTLLRPILANEY